MNDPSDRLALVEDWHDHQELRRVIGHEEDWSEVGGRRSEVGGRRSEDGARVGRIRLGPPTLPSSAVRLVASLYERRCEWGGLGEIRKSAVHSLFMGITASGRVSDGRRRAATGRRCGWAWVVLGKKRKARSIREPETSQPSRGITADRAGSTLPG